MLRNYSRTELSKEEIDKLVNEIIADNRVFTKKRRASTDYLESLKDKNGIPFISTPASRELKRLLDEEEKAKSELDSKLEKLRQLTHRYPDES